MSNLRAISLGITSVILLGVYAIWRVRRDFGADGRLSVRTTIVVWAAYLLHAGLTGYVAWRSFWTMPTPVPIARLVGSVVLVAGLMIAGAGIREFRSISRMSGRDENELVTTGIYRLSRNPQNVGWIATLTGVSILGRSVLAFTLVGLFTLLIHVYLVFVEEPHLIRGFGSTYQQYRLRTPRYFAIRRKQSSRWDE